MFVEILALIKRKSVTQMGRASKNSIGGLLRDKLMTNGHNGAELGVLK